MTGEAKFIYLHDTGALDIQDGLKQAFRYVDAKLNPIDDRPGTNRTG